MSGPGHQSGTSCHESQKLCRYNDVYIDYVSVWLEIRNVKRINYRWPKLSVVDYNLMKREFKGNLTLQHG